MEQQTERENETQQLQNKVDRLKLLNLTSNIHNLAPPQMRQEDSARDVALVNALSVSPRLAELFMEIRGMEIDVRTHKFIQITKPIMNILGAYRFCKLLKRLTEEIEWASYSEEEINPRVIHYFEENIPYFLFYNSEYDLNPSDFNYVITVLQNFIDTSFHKSKQGKYINTLGRTYSEDTLRKALETEGFKKGKGDEGFLSKYNPFKDKR